MIKMKYRWLLFDADGTLFDYDNAEYSALKQTSKFFGIKFSSAYHLKYRQINNSLFKKLEKGLVTPAELRTQRFKRLFAEFDIDLEIDSFSRMYLNHLSKNSMLIPGALDTIQALHPAFKMLVVTNGLAEVQRPRFEKSSLSPYFVDILISEDIGAAKPANEFFEAAFKKMGAPDKDKVIIIGDSLTSDMAGGLHFGIDTCWFNPWQTKNDVNLDITYEIKKLPKLIDIVNGDV
jgi:putative hydrolase of the HAD superfamily